MHFTSSYHWPSEVRRTSTPLKINIEPKHHQIEIRKIESEQSTSILGVPAIDFPGCNQQNPEVLKADLLPQLRWPSASWSREVKIYELHRKNHQMFLVASPVFFGEFLVVFSCFTYFLVGFSMFLVGSPCFLVGCSAGFTTVAWK